MKMTIQYCLFPLSSTQPFPFSLNLTQPLVFHSAQLNILLFHSGKKTFLFHSGPHYLLLRLKQFMLCVRASSRHNSFFFSVVCIGHYESGLQTDAVGTQGEDGTHDHGLFQVFFLFFLVDCGLWCFLHGNKSTL